MKYFTETQVGYSYSVAIFALGEKTPVIKEA